MAVRHHPWLGVRGFFSDALQVLFTDWCFLFPGVFSSLCVWARSTSIVWLYNRSKHNSFITIPHSGGTTQSVLVSWKHGECIGLLYIAVLATREMGNTKKATSTLLFGTAHHPVWISATGQLCALTGSFLHTIWGNSMPQEVPQQTPFLHAGARFGMRFHMPVPVAL